MNNGYDHAAPVELPAPGERIELSFEQIFAAQVVDYAFLRSTRGSVEQDFAFHGLRMRLMAWLGGERLDSHRVTFPADWLSAVYDALDTWWTEQGVRSATHWGTELCYWVARKCSARVRWKEHRWEVRREWVDVVYEGQRTMVRAYLDGRPHVHRDGAARDHFMRQYHEVLMGYAHYDSAHPDEKVRMLLEAAEMCNWRDTLR